MKKVHLLISALVLAVFFPFTSNCQNSYQVKGTVLDLATKKPAKYMNIGILDQGVGTVSTDSGRFSLTIPANMLNDSLTFSRIGYQKIKLPIREALKMEAFYISREAVPLQEVKIASSQLKIKTKGNMTRSKSIVLGLTNPHSLGTELGTLIRLPEKPVYINDFNFHIIYNRPDSVKLRLNIYAFDKKIGKNLLNRNIYFTVPGGKLGDFKVDLRKYGIEAHGDVFVSVEVVAVYISKGPDPNKKFDQYWYDRLKVSGTVTGSKSFFRKVSLDKWEKTDLHFSPGFWLTVAY